MRGEASMGLYKVFKIDFWMGLVLDASQKF